MDVTCCVCSELSTEGCTQSVSTLSTELLSEVANYCELKQPCHLYYCSDFRLIMDVTCCVCSEPSTEGSTQSVSTLSTELLSEVANHCTLPRVCTSCLNTVTNICSLKRSLKRKNRPTTPVTGQCKKHFLVQLKSLPIHIFSFFLSVLLKFHHILGTSIQLKEILYEIMLHVLQGRFRKNEALV